MSELELFAAYKNGRYQPMMRCATPKCPALIDADDDSIFCASCWLEMMSDGRSA